MQVPFLDLNAIHAQLGEEISQAVDRVIRSGRFILGDELAGFEEEFARYCDASDCVGVANGLDALHLLLRAHGIGLGDEVIVPAHTFVATWLAVSHCGATPVAVDVSPSTGNLAPELLEEAITARTRAVVVVHLHGLPAELDAIVPVARRHGLIVLEDAAQAHGARHHGRPVGVLADGAAFSFYPGKNLGAMGDAGCVVTDDPAMAERVRRLRNYGGLDKYEHAAIGFNSRLDELQAAVLRAKLNHLDTWNAQRREIADAYLEALDPAVFDMLDPSPGSTPVWHLFAVRHAGRDRVRAALLAEGIETGIHYPSPVHLVGAYQDLYGQEGRFPVAEDFAGRGLSLPIGPHMTVASARDVASAANASGGAS